MLFFRLFLAFAPLVAEAFEAVFALRQNNLHLEPESAALADLGDNAVFSAMHIKDAFDYRESESAAMIALSRGIGAVIALPDLSLIHIFMIAVHCSIL